MSVPLALQLYTVRDILAQDFEGGVEQVARIGYAGVEPAGFAGTTVIKADRLFRDLGLRVPSVHTHAPVGEHKNEALDTAEQLGSPRLICSMPEAMAATLDGFRAFFDQMNEAAANAAERGLSFGLHNHWWEFNQVDGRQGFDWGLELLSPEIFYEVDTYWAKTGGQDPAELVQRLGARAPLLHIKDGPATTQDPQLAVGDGVLDFPAIVRAGAGHTQWMVVELDRCATDMMEAVRKSYEYLTMNGLAQGR